MILAFDVSGSMAADDLQPTRMEAAKVAARAFVERQPASILIGVVAFSDSGFSIQVPTGDETAGPRGDRPPRAGARHVARAGESWRRSRRSPLPTRTRLPATTANRSPEPTPLPTPVPDGTYAPAVIVLLTDGENNQSPDPLRGGAGGRRPRRPDPHGRDRQHGRDDARGRGLQGPQPARRGDAPADRGDHRWRLLRGGGLRRAERDLRQDRHPTRDPAGGDGSHLALCGRRRPGPPDRRHRVARCGSDGCREPEPAGDQRTSGP